MLGSPNDKIRGALRRLSNDSDFQALLEFFANEREELVKTLSMHLSEPIVRQAQGGVQLLDDIKHFVEISKRA